MAAIPTNVNSLSTAVQSTVRCAPVVSSAQAQPSTAGAAVNNVGQARTVGEIESETVGNSQRNADHLSTNPVRDWANAVGGSSTPVATHNRFSVLHDCEDNVNNDNDDNPFIEQSSRRAFKRRRHQSRQQVQQQQQQQQSQQQQQPGPRVSERRPGQGLLTGKLKYTLPGQRFKAAKNVIRKAVFCIDNVHPSVELDDLRLFVTGLALS